MKFTALIASFLLVPAGALDIIMQSVTCDDSLPIYASTFTVTCDGAARCTFGNTATIAGERKLDLTCAGFDEDAVPCPISHSSRSCFV
jgi:hypothetical protein